MLDGVTSIGKMEPGNCDYRTGSQKDGQECFKSDNCQWKKDETGYSCGYNQAFGIDLGDAQPKTCTKTSFCGKSLTLVAVVTTYCTSAVYMTASLASAFVIVASQL